MLEVNTRGSFKMVKSVLLVATLIKCDNVVTIQW